MPQVESKMRRGDPKNPWITKRVMQSNNKRKAITSEVYNTPIVKI